MILRTVLVVGAGLAGLSAAIALAKRGAQVTVATLDGGNDGTSITITNRAVDAVEALGVLDQCLAHGLYPSGPQSIFSAMMDSAGNPLAVPPPPPRPDTRLPGWIAIYRPDLGRILTHAAEAAGVTIRTGVTFSSLIDRGTHVDVALTDGTTGQFDLVVGADGSHSAVRGVIHPGLEPNYSGTMSFRILLENGPEGVAGFYSTPPGGYGQLATVRLPGNRLYLAAGKRMDNRRLDQPEALALLDEVLAPYTAPLVQGIRMRLGDPPHVYARPFEYLIVPAPWHRGRITIIGDAAHATTPNLASGGSIALEDGVVLAEELAKGESMAEGLDAFTQRRHARCAMVVETSHAMMEVGGDARESARLRGAALAELVRPY